MYKRLLTVTIHRTGAMQITEDSGAARRLIRNKTTDTTVRQILGHVLIAVMAAVVIAEVFLISSLIFDICLPKQTDTEKPSGMTTWTVPTEQNGTAKPEHPAKAEPQIHVNQGDPIQQISIDEAAETNTVAETTTKTAPQPEPVPEKQTTKPTATDCLFSEEEIIRMAKTVHGEALITRSDMHMAAVVWCILNRYDSGRYTKDITAIVNPGQFNGYNPENPVSNHVLELVKDVVARYTAEKQGQTDVGRVLPKDYIYFTGDGVVNHFTNKWPDGPDWDWSLPNPYPN